jgi:ribosomal protein L15E
MSYAQPNETTELWKEVHQSQAEARAKRKFANLEILRASVLPFTYRNDNDVVLVRDAHYPAITFWPSANHWKVGNRDMMGSASDLIDYLRRKAMR